MRVHAFVKPRALRLQPLCQSAASADLPRLDAGAAPNVLDGDIGAGSNCPHDDHKRGGIAIAAPHATERGFIAIDRAGSILLADGLGADREVQRICGSPAWRREARRRRLTTLELRGRRMIALLWPQDEGELVLLRPAGDREELFDFINCVDFAFDILNRVVSSPFDGMTVVDAEARLVYMSAVHEKFFGLARGEAFGRAATEVIENTRLPEVVRTGQAEIGDLQTMRDQTRVVSRIPVLREGKVVGAFGRIMFKGPEQLERLHQEIARLRTEVAYLREETRSLRRRSYGLESIIGGSPAMRALKADLVKIAPLDVPVLLVGESGTGKELAAQALHRLSPRRERPMVMVNAAAMPFSLVESELFGYEPGAFTGAARKGHRGKFELAHNSTLFLDEIGDMPAEVQAKLLRVLQDGLIERVGGERPRQVDFRLITATNHDIRQFIDEGRFRLDLYYRISPVILRLPPLRERPDDIPLLIDHFVEALSVRHRRRIRRIHAEVYRYLRELPWPGNVRQLRHEVERALIFGEGEELTVEAFRPGERMPEMSSALLTSGANGDLKTLLDQVERSAIQEAMARHRGNKKRVAEELGISRSYLYKKLEEQRGPGSGPVPVPDALERHFP